MYIYVHITAPIYHMVVSCNELKILINNDKLKIYYDVLTFECDFWNIKHYLKTKVWLVEFRRNLNMKPDLFLMFSDELMSFVTGYSPVVWQDIHVFLPIPSTRWRNQRVKISISWADVHGTGEKLVKTTHPRVPARNRIHGRHWVWFKPGL